MSASREIVEFDDNDEPLVDENILLSDELLEHVPPELKELPELPKRWFLGYSQCELPSLF